MGALVLKTFDVNESATGTDDAVHVIGRQAGFMGFLLSIAKIDPTTEISCNDERIIVHQSSFFGKQSICMPIAVVSGIGAGITSRRNYYLVFLACFSWWHGFGTSENAIPFVIALIAAIVMFVVYLLKKEMSPPKWW